mgnify:FL=1
MKVSIIIPVYKVEKYLNECVQSVVNQTYKDLEIILVDDGSPDKCPEICDEYAKQDKRIKVVHRKNGGLSAARNSGIKMATGKYIYFLDSDDKIFPNAIEQLVKFTYKYKEVDIVQGNYAPLSGYENLIYTKKRFPNEFVTDKAILQRMVLNIGGAITATNKLIRTQFITSHNLYFFEGVLHEDMIWEWYVHNHINSIAICLEKTYWYRTNNVSSIMNCKDKTNSFISMMKIAEQIAPYAKEKYELRYLFYFCSMYAKEREWPYIKDKCKATTAIKHLYKICKHSNALRVIKNEIFFMTLSERVTRILYAVKFFAFYARLYRNKYE